MSAADKYRDCAARGLSQAEAARELGVSREAVWLATKRYGIAFVSQAARVLAPARRAAVADLARRGMTNHEIAAEAGVGIVTAIKHRKAAGIPCNRKPQAHPVVNQIAALAADGLTVSEVAAALGIARSNVSWIKKRHGIRFLRDGRFK
jgi:DNA-binding CsgD family transcriptional regulator